jgi:pyruvate/2-oxoglutarate/acetoin dehydrogenase E1 component
VLQSVKKTSKAILLHEATLTGGIGGELAARLAERAFEYLDGPVVRIASPDAPVPYSAPLEQAYLPDVKRVTEKARWLARY